MKTQSCQKETVERNSNHREVAKSIFDAFTDTADYKDFLSVLQLLFRTSFEEAKIEKWNIQERRAFNHHFYQIRSIVEEAFACDTKSPQSIDTTLNRISVDIDDAILESNIVKIRQHILMMMEHFFSSEDFQIHPLIYKIILFHQEMDRMLVDLEPLLLSRK